MADQEGYGASWQAATMASVAEHARLADDIDVDICVIGGGFAGLTAACEIARGGSSVVLLETGRLGAAASGRNTGFALPGFGEDLQKIIERVGPDHARALWRLSEEGLAHVRSTIAASGRDDIMLGDGWLWVAKKGSGLSPAHEADTLNAHGATVAHWSADLVTAHLRSPLYADAVYFPTAFHIHPLNYIGALVTAAQDAGVRIFENTPAVSIDPAGVRKRIDTPAGRVRARQVVIAGNTRIGGPMPRLSGTLLPVTTYVVTTAPLGPTLGEAIAFRGAVSDTDWADNHYRIVDGDRLMWSGGCTAWQRDPNGFRKRLAKDIRRTFPQLDGITIDYAWSGTLGVPVHRMPQIGELMSGLWVASGFSGHGINTTAMAGRLIAAAITDGDDRWRLFSPYHLAWAGGTAGRVAMQASYRLSRFRDLLQAWLRATSQRGKTKDLAGTKDLGGKKDRGGTK